MRRQLVPAAVAFFAFTVLTGIAYPLVVTGISQVAFSDKANGSLIERNGQVVGSSLIGQMFFAPRYFRPRPSAAGAGNGYDAMSSSASNLGPANEEFLQEVDQRRTAYRQANGADPPIDAITASGSGLDPHISPENARLQAPRVARARGLDVEVVLELVEENTDDRSLGFLGEPGVNVLELNLALDSA